MQPTWQTSDGAVQLYLGDCLDVRDELPKNGAIVSDPPYGIQHTARRGQTCGRSTLRNPGKHGDAYGRFEGQIVGDSEPFDPGPWLKWPCVLWGAGYYHERLPRGGWLLWDKKCDAGFENWHAGDGDMAWTSRPCAPRVFRMVWMGLVRGEVEKVKGGQNAPSWHPNQKPVALMEWCFRFVDAGTIIDPYMGSGTTGLACIRTGRKFIGCEIDPVHFATAQRRIEAELSRAPLFEPAPQIQRELIA